MLPSTTIAAAEMMRLRKAHAWNPEHKVVGTRKNQHAARHTFEDGSVLAVYFNGDAAWISAQYGRQRWRGWHYCNR